MKLTISVTRWLTILSFHIWPFTTTVKICAIANCSFLSSFNISQIVNLRFKNSQKIFCQSGKILTNQVTLLTVVFWYREQYCPQSWCKSTLLLVKKLNLKFRNSHGAAICCNRRYRVGSSWTRQLTEQIKMPHPDFLNISFYRWNFEGIRNWWPV